MATLVEELVFGGGRGGSVGIIHLVGWAGCVRRNLFEKEGDPAGAGHEVVVARLVDGGEGGLQGLKRVGADQLYHAGLEVRQFLGGCEVLEDDDAVAGVRGQLLRGHEAHEGIRGHGPPGHRTGMEGETVLEVWDDGVEIHTK